MDEAIKVEVSSCQELVEMRQKVENTALQAAQQRVDEIVRQAMAEEAEKLAERNILEEELANEIRSLSIHRILLAKYQEFAVHQLQEMLGLQAQLTKVREDNVHQQSMLQALRGQNHDALQSDPIFILLQEESQLRQQLQDMGIMMCIPTGAVPKEHGNYI